MYKLPKRPGYAGGVPWPGFFTFLLVGLAGSWIATFYLAARADAAVLGAPSFQLLGWSVYPLFSWVHWVVPLFRQPGDAGAWLAFEAAAIAVLSWPIGLQLGRGANSLRMRGLTRNTDDIHGSAQYATRSDLERNHLLGREDGIIVGCWWDQAKTCMHILRHKGPEHILAFAPTRKGKGVSAVVPNLLEWPDSVLVNDMKGELWNLTSGFRQKELGQVCIKWRPTEEDTDGYNPLAEVRLATNEEVKDVQNIAHIFVRGDHAQAPGGDNGHWLDVAEALMGGMILHALYVARVEKRPTPTLAGIYFSLTPPGMSFHDWLEVNVNYAHDPNGEFHWTVSPDETAPTVTHPVVRKAFQELLDKAHEDFDGTVSSLAAKLHLFSDPLIQKATSFSSFTCRDLLRNPQKHSVYLVMPMSDRKRLAPLLRLIATQVVMRNSEKMDGKRNAPLHWLLVMLDEFLALGRMELFNDALTYMAGFQMKAFLIATSIPGIRGVYGDKTTLLSNTNVKIAYTPDDIKDAEPISDLTGKTTVPRLSVTWSGQKNALAGATGTSMTEVLEKRNLLEPDEVYRLKTLQVIDEPNGQVRLVPGDQLLFIPGCNPIFGVQFLYPHNHELLRRSQLGPALRAQPEDAEAQQFRTMLAEALKSA